MCNITCKFKLDVCFPFWTQNWTPYLDITWNQFDTITGWIHHLSRNKPNMMLMPMGCQLKSYTKAKSVIWQIWDNLSKERFNSIKYFRLYSGPPSPIFLKPILSLKFMQRFELSTELSNWKILVTPGPEPWTSTCQ